MPIYQRSSTGPEVKRVQERLRELSHHRGPLDGVFDGGIESAVKSFQRAEEILVDGIVGPQTWSHLFDGEDVPAPAVVDEPLAHRSLALTGSFETGTPPPECFAGLSGDFDGQGISFGCLQWNLGQGSLQPLLQKMGQRHPEVMEDVFGEYHPEFQSVLEAPQREQLAGLARCRTRTGTCCTSPGVASLSPSGAEKPARTSRWKRLMRSTRTPWTWPRSTRSTRIGP